MNITITDVEKIMKSWKNDPEYLIEMLQDIQESCRYLPEEALRHIAHTLDVPLKRLYHISTFFSMFSLEEKGENIVQVCMGTACHVKGAPAVLEAFARELKINPGETTKDKKFTVEGVRCLGCCSLAPAVAINEKIYGGVTVGQVPGIIKETKGTAKPKKAAKAKAKAANCACEEKAPAKKSKPAAKAKKAKVTKTAKPKAKAATKTKAKTTAKAKPKAAKPAKAKTAAKPKAKAAKPAKAKTTAKPKAKATKAKKTTVTKTAKPKAKTTAKPKAKPKAKPAKTAAKPKTKAAKVTKSKKTASKAKAKPKAKAVKKGGK